MKGIRVCPEARRARVEAGVLWSELDRETQKFELAITGGIVSHTGVTGLTLGGGIGWLHRKHGLTIDQLITVDLVTAEGDSVRASETENPDRYHFRSCDVVERSDDVIDVMVDHGRRIERLKAIKRAYDPTNFFRLNQNIPPD